MNLIHMFLRWCPGALGLFLRQKIYPRHFKSCGRGVLFGRFLSLRHPERITIGKNVVLNNRVHLEVNKESFPQQTLIIEDNVFIGEGTALKCQTGNMTIQSGSNISSCCLLTAYSSFTIGKKVLIASYCSIGDATDKKIVNPDNFEEVVTHIGNGCWLGTRARVATGVSIGEDTIIGAHSHVNLDLPARAVCFGQPAAKYRNRN